VRCPSECNSSRPPAELTLRSCQSCLPPLCQPVRTIRTDRPPQITSIQDIFVILGQVPPQEAWGWHTSRSPAIGDGMGRGLPRSDGSGSGEMRASIGRKMSQPSTSVSPAKVKKRKPRAHNAPPAIDIHARAPKAAKNSDIVYRDLRRAIIAMELTPGTPIIEKEITEHYGISRTPVREAVLKLAEDRLVDVMPKSGTFVSRIPLSVLREALVARRALEEVTVRAATARASES